MYGLCLFCYSIFIPLKTMLNATYPIYPTTRQQSERLGSHCNLTVSLMAAIPVFCGWRHTARAQAQRVGILSALMEWFYAC